MKEVDAYKDIASAMADLDNGGRFWNILSRKSDAVISAAELSKASGTLGDMQSAFAYYEVAARALDAASRDKLDHCLAPGLASSYADHKPLRLLSRPMDSDLAGRYATVQGCLRPLPPQDPAAGAMVLTPVIAGELTTFVETPILAIFDLFFVGDGDQPVIIASPRGLLESQADGHGVYTVAGPLHRTENSSTMPVYLEVEFIGHN